MNRLTLAIKIMACLGIAAGIVAAWGWNPPLDPHFIQACGCIAAVTQAVNLYLGARPVAPAVLAKAHYNLPIK